MNRFRKLLIAVLAMTLLLGLLAAPALANPYSDGWSNCTFGAWQAAYELLGVQLPAWGDAKTWYNSAANAGYSVGTTPQAPSIVVLTDDMAGHVAYVTEIGNGQIYVIEGGYEGGRHEGWMTYPNPGRYRVDASGNRHPQSIVGFIYLAPQKATLDVNGYLDGANNGGIAGYGTFDVYINGSKVADDVGDYCNSSLAIGATYQISDIRAVGEHTYDGVHSGSLSGTLSASGANVRLIFNSYGTLDVTQMVDGAGSSMGGTFSVKINGSLDSSGVSGYSRDWPQGTTYSITDVRAGNGKYYAGAYSGNLSGTIGRGTTAVKLSFLTIVPATAEWKEAEAVPGYLDSSTLDVEYNNHYKRTAQTSPGAGWTQVAGSGVTTYVNDGGVYDSDFALETSSTRVQVGSYYYHYCGASMGNRVNFAQTSQYTDYHVAGDVNSFNVTGEWTDDDDARYHSYKLVWNSGQWAGGEATCSAGRSAIWYRRYQYQNKKAVTNYTWTKDSGWTTTADSSAASVTVRYRLKQYTISFDANGGSNAPASIPKYATLELTLPETLPERGGYRFVGWNTQADGQGTLYQPGQAYDVDGNATLYAQWTVATRLVLPASLKAIGEEAFAGTGALIIVVPDGCGSIGTRAFADSDALAQIYIPASVTEISFDAFEGCDSLTIFAPENSTAIRLAKALQIPYEITQ